MVETHRETFWLIIEHPDYIPKDKFGDDKVGRLTPFMSEDISQVRFYAQEYALLFGLSYDAVDDPFVDSHPESESEK